MLKHLYLLVRSLAERCAAACLILVLSPLLLALAYVIRLSMGSPVLFKQRRIGYHGRPFTVWKFRTMVPAAHQVADQVNPLEAGLIPPLGRLLRRTSLDELPQLANILFGDMSFIGPRPMLPEIYEHCTPRQRLRTLVPQGITGLAQVRYRNNAPWSVRIEADLHYVHTVGPLTDLRILEQTITKVIKREDVRLDQTAAQVDDLTPSTP